MTNHRPGKVSSNISCFLSSVLRLESSISSNSGGGGLEHLPKPSLDFIFGLGSMTLISFSPKLILFFCFDDTEDLLVLMMFGAEVLLDMDDPEPVPLNLRIPAMNYTYLSMRKFTRRYLVYKHYQWQFA